MRDVSAIICSVTVWFSAVLSAQADLTSDLNGVVQNYMTQDQIPGVMVGVWQGNTQIAYVGDGVSDLTNMTPIAEDDEFKIGSITKSMTVTLLLQLADQGLVNLNDPISNYVPGLSNGMGNATLQQLANMTSGIPNYSENSDFKTAIGTNPMQTWTDSQLVAFANAELPLYAPGTGPWNYSNTNTVLLGMVVAKVTNGTLQAAMNSMFGSLNMKSTIYPNPSVSSLSAPFLHGYNGVGADQAESDVSDVLSSSIFSGAGAVYSTLDDLAIWGRTLGQGTLLSTNMQNMRLQFISTGETDPTSGEMPFYDKYGLGIGEIDGWIGHTGDQPGYQDLVLYNPSTDQTIVIVQNYGNGEPNIPTLMFQDMVGFLAVPEPSTWALTVVGAVLLAMASLRFKTRS